MVFADENRRLYGGFGGRKFPILRIKIFWNVRKIILERSRNKNRTFQNKKSNVRFSKNERSKIFFRRIVNFSAHNLKKFCAENKKILRRK